MTALLVVGVTTPRAAAARAQVVGPVEVILDASGSMRGALGDTVKMAAARRFVEAFRTALAESGEPPPMALRIYGGGSPSVQRDCRDTRLEVRRGAPAAEWALTLGAVRPLGVSPLAYALERAAADTFTTYVLVSDGGDNCGGDPCAVWRDLVRPDGNRRARIHVVAVGAEPAAVETLRCVSRAGSGWFTTLRDPSEVEPAARRLARVLRNRGLVEVRLSGGGEPLAAPIRLLRPLSGEVVASFPEAGIHEVPAGIYTVVIETVPEERVERVLVLPGETVTIERGGFGRLLVELAGGGPPARVSVRSAGGAALAAARSGDPVVLRAGRYDVRADLGDSVAVRRGVEIVPGSTTRLVVGPPPGGLVVVAPGFDRPPQTRAILSAGDVADTIAVGEPATLPAGRYRLVVRTMPPYVSESVVVEAGRETVVTLPPTGILAVEVLGPEGPIDGVRAEVRERLTGEAYGSVPSGTARLVMPGAYRVEVRTVPVRAEDVRVAAGETRTVTVRGVGLLETVPVPAGEADVRLEVFAAGGDGRLGEASGTRPALPVWPGAYRARVTRAGAPLWEGRVVVAEGETTRIDWRES